MSKFLTGKELEDKLTDIIWEAEEYIYLLSPFIKLDEYVKSVFEKIKTKHEVTLYLVFGKNARSKQKSLNKQDLEYFKEFKNVIILYSENLHAKYYGNERDGLITSLNLYEYSLEHNLEYGVHFERNLLNPLGNLFTETDSNTEHLIENEFELIFLKKPIYSKGLLGIGKKYQDSKIIYDVSKEFFMNSRKYEIKHLISFDIDIATSMEKSFSSKPQRISKVDSDTTKNKESKNLKTGFCIRSGKSIKFNPNIPLIYEEYLIWIQYENYDWPENYCHKTGEKSFGKTSMRNPILKKNQHNS